MNSDKVEGTGTELKHSDLPLELNEELYMYRIQINYFFNHCRTNDLKLVSIVDIKRTSDLTLEISKLGPRRLG